jgi:hypothetical protein
MSLRLVTLSCYSNYPTDILAKQGWMNTLYDRIISNGQINPVYCVIFAWPSTVQGSWETMDLTPVSIRQLDRQLHPLTMHGVISGR